MPVPKHYLVKMGDTASLSNILNEMFYEEKMTLQELRFFLVYLSKINPKEPGNTDVTFSFEEYAEILGVELNEKAIETAPKNVLRRLVCVRPDVLNDDVVEDCYYCQLFKRARLFRKRVDNKWYLTFTCHEDIEDKIFNLNSAYTKLEIWNAVNLSNFQDIRMYMLLRQYRVAGERTIDLKELKKMLGIDADAYPEYKIFSRDVLKKCQKALEKRTDICFDFNAVGRPAKAVHFDIYKNENYVLPAFLAEAEESVIDAEVVADDEQEQISLFGDAPEDPWQLSIDALPDWLTRGQVAELRELARKHIPFETPLNQVEEWFYHYFRQKVLRMEATKNIENPYSWLRSAVDKNYQ